MEGKNSDLAASYEYEACIGAVGNKTPIECINTEIIRTGMDQLSKIGMDQLSKIVKSRDTEQRMQGWETLPDLY